MIATRLMRFILVGGLFMLGAFTGPATSAAQGAAENTVTITGAWARMTPMSGAIFGTLHLNGDIEDRLTGISCPDMSDTIELHTTSMTEGGIMQMQAVTELALPPGLDITMEPGGMHIMLMGLKTKKKPGESIDCTMRFAHAPELSFSAEIRPLGGEAGAGRSFE